MSKAARIMELYDGIRSTSDIADMVGCDPAYVRVVARQRKGSGTSDIDRRYKASPKGQFQRVLNNAGTLARQKTLHRTSDRAALRAIYRLAYRVARNDGNSVERSADIARNIKAKAARRIGDKNAATKAAAGARAKLISAATMEGTNLKTDTAMRA